MNKKIKIGISILLLLIITSFQISYAIGNNEKNSFFTVNKLEISPEETLEMTFDISSLEYNKFTILLNSSISSQNIYTKDDANISIKDDSNGVSIEIDKNKMNLDKLTLYYPIPKDIEIGTSIELLAQIKVNKQIQKDEQANNIVGNKLDNKAENENRDISDNFTDKQESETKEEIVKEETRIIKVVQKINDENGNKENDGNKGNKPNEDSKQEETSKKPNEENSKQEQTDKAEKEFSNGVQTNNVSSQRTSMSGNMNLGTANSNIENQAIYNGSNNNYLSNLVVEGLEFNTSFNKENSTYFINTNNTNDITITATAEDATAKVYITGNDNITNGENKILISVTAENGNVRYYRIFVTCEEESNET